MIKTYVIDTNVLIQAPYALHRFEAMMREAWRMVSAFQAFISAAFPKYWGKSSCVMSWTVMT